MQVFNNLQVMKGRPRGLLASAHTDGSASNSLSEAVELDDLGEENKTQS